MSENNDIRLAVAWQDTCDEPDTWELWDEVEEAQAALDLATTQLHEHVAEHLGPDDRDVLWSLYWGSAFPAKPLSEALGVPIDRVGMALQPGPLVACGVCGESLPISSRSRLVVWNRDPKERVCPRCIAGQRHQRDEWWRRQRTMEVQRKHELKTMPYSEYLRTPEWDATRRAAYRRAKYRCQLCGARNVRLNVHHNTYERRGEELAADLIALCEPCHYEHHGKLP